MAKHTPQTGESADEAVSQTPPVPPVADEPPQEDWKGKYLRALADYQNLLRRTAEERDEERKYASRHAVDVLLPVIDLFRAAQQHLNNEGLALALKEADAALSKLGIEPIDPAGKPFDAETMECVEAVQGATTVSSVVARGYRMYGKVIRPAKVVVGQRADAEAKRE
jgi:molecular chaperone GrpE